jgi:Flp pilus assembly pilin Flp
VKNLTRLWVTLSTYAIPPSKKNDTGATMLEYAAIVILVAAVAIAIYALDLSTSISDAIGSSVTQILQGSP